MGRSTVRRSTVSGVERGVNRLAGDVFVDSHDATGGGMHVLQNSPVSQSMTMNIVGVRGGHGRNWRHHMAGAAGGDGKRRRVQGQSRMRTRARGDAGVYGEQRAVEAVDLDAAP